MEFLDAESAISRPLELADVYYTPEYGLSAELIDGGVWECAVSDDGLVFPYIKRSINLDDAGGYDIVSPYGYGGVHAPSPRALANFRREFLKQSRDRGLVAEFLRAHPRDMDSAMVEAWGPDSVTDHTTFGVTINLDPDEYFSQAQGRHRTAVRKAHKNEIEVVEVDASSSLRSDTPFRVIYAETMSRIGASSRLMLDDHYFQRLSKVGEGLVLLEARRKDSGETVAAAMFLRTATRVHYHLSGTRPEGQRLGATNLLIDHAIRTLLQDGGWIHLGGGVGPDDGLTRFKQSISNVTHQMAMCRTVVDPSRYASLNRIAGQPETDFFPAYRAVQ